MTYAGMLLAAAAIFLLVRSYGDPLSAPPSGACVGRTAAAEAAGSQNVLFHVLLVLAVVAVAGRLLGSLFARPSAAGHRRGRRRDRARTVAARPPGPGRRGIRAAAVDRPLPERRLTDRHRPVHVSGGRRSERRSPAAAHARDGGNLACEHRRAVRPWIGAPP